MNPIETKVYITGKISGLEESEYLPIFQEAAEFLRGQGFTPINPLEVVPECAEACNSGLTFEDGRYMHTWQCYMKADIKAMMDCEAILPLPNSGDSRGSQLELVIAEQVGLVLFTREGDNLDWTIE